MPENIKEYDENIVYDYGPEKPKNDHHARKIKVEDDDGNLKIDEDKALGGMILLGLGVFFFLKALGVSDFDFDWWTLFLFIPGIAMLTNVWSAYRRTGHVPKRFREQGVGGVFLILVGSIFLFGLDWGVMWPVFLIIIGIALLIGWLE
jgi:hypothetical protein